MGKWNGNLAGGLCFVVRCWFRFTRYSFMRLISNSETFQIVNCLVSVDLSEFTMQWIKCRRRKRRSRRGRRWRRRSWIIRRRRGRRSRISLWIRCNYYQIPEYLKDFYSSDSTWIFFYICIYKTCHATLFFFPVICKEHLRDKLVPVTTST